MLTAGGKANFAGEADAHDARARTHARTQAHTHTRTAGARHWLRNSEAALLDRIDFALCLDSIGLQSIILYYYIYIILL